MDSSNPVIVFDLDGTLCKRDTYLPFLLGYLLRHPWRFIRTLHLPIATAMYLLGLRNNSWLKQVFLRACLGGLSRISLQSWVNIYIQSILINNLRPGAVKKLQQYKESKSLLVLASASLDIYVKELGSKLGFKHVICTNADWDDNDRLTGKLLSANCYGEEKLQRVTNWLAENQYKNVDVVYSDHHSDIPILQYATKGVAVNPTKKLRNVSRELQLEMENW